MKPVKFVTMILVILSQASSLLQARDILLEFKGSYFLPTNHCFKDIYKGNALYGPELSVQLSSKSKWFAFTSFDYLHTRGKSIGLCNKTKVTLLPLAFGIKYFGLDVCNICNLYAGLGIETMNVRTVNYLGNCKDKISKWGVGGIVKVGSYCNILHNLFLDVFFNYSFIYAGKNKWCTSPATLWKKASVQGAIFGIGLGYKFN